METKLLPCPFCGGEGVVGCAYGSVYGISDDWFIECARCGTTNINPTRGHATEAEAIEAWNTRHERTCRLIAIDGGYEEPVYAWACDQCGNDEIDTSYVRCWKCNAKVVGHD